VQSVLLHIRRTGALCLQALRNSVQENDVSPKPKTAQDHVEHCTVTLHEVA
jgi:hypothetical protein